MSATSGFSAVRQGPGQLGHPVVGGGAVHGDGADREQLVPDLEQFFEELLGVVGDLGPASPAVPDARTPWPARRSVRSRGGSARRRSPRTTRTASAPAGARSRCRCRHCLGVQERDRGVHRRVQRAVHRDQVVAAEELIQLDVVHVTALPISGACSTVNTWSSYTWIFET